MANALPILLLGGAAVMLMAGGKKKKKKKSDDGATASGPEDNVDDWEIGKHNQLIEFGEMESGKAAIQYRIYRNPDPLDRHRPWYHAFVTTGDVPVRKGYWSIFMEAFRTQDDAKRDLEELVERWSKH